MAAGRSISPSTSTAVSGPPASGPPPGQVEVFEAVVLQVLGRLRLEAGEDALQLDHRAAQRIYDLAVADLERLDLFPGGAAAGEVGEDPLPQLPRASVIMARPSAFASSTSADAASAASCRRCAASSSASPRSRAAST